MIKTGRDSDAQILRILNQAEGAVPVSELCREHRMSSTIFKSGGLSLAVWMYFDHRDERHGRTKLTA